MVTLPVGPAPVAPMPVAMPVRPPPLPGVTSAATPMMAMLATMPQTMTTAV